MFELVRSSDRDYILNLIVVQAIGTAMEQLYAPVRVQEPAENSPERRLEKRTGAITAIITSRMYLELTEENRLGIFVPDPANTDVSKRRWECSTMQFRQDVREMNFRQWKEKSVISGAGSEFNDSSCGSSTKGLWDLESAASHQQ